MTEMRHNSVVLDPQNITDSLRQLIEIYNLDEKTTSIAHRIIALYPRPVQMYVDPANAMLYQNLAMADKFTFDMETDELVLFSEDTDTLIDALIEMVMYLVGFATMIGNDEEWVIEFTVGAWKPVKNRLKRQLGIHVHEKPRGVVGLPPAPEKTLPDDPYPFRTLVSSYDVASFHQMVVLAARDDIAVYFPPEAHPKVLAVYVYMRRAMQEVAEGLDLQDYQTFNTRLVDAVHRLQNLFDPASLAPPGSIKGSTAPRTTVDDQANQYGLFPNDLDSASHPQGSNPFESFIEQLFSDDDSEDPTR